MSTSMSASVAETTPAPAPRTLRWRVVDIVVAAVLLAGSLTLVPSLAQAATSPASARTAQAGLLPQAPADLPVADVLDVDLRDGTPADHAQQLTARTVGEPVFTSDAARARSIARPKVANACGYSERI